MVNLKYKTAFYLSDIILFSEIARLQFCFELSRPIHYFLARFSYFYVEISVNK